MPPRGSFWSPAARSFIERRNGKMRAVGSVTGEALERAKGLYIPPAWTNVRVSPRKEDRVQAVGTDAAGRRQYIYNKNWVRRAASGKFARVLRLATRMPGIERRVEADVQAGRTEAAMALIARRLCIRAGSAKGLRDHSSVGLTTMAPGNVRVRGDTVRFEFKGKHGVAHSLSMEHRGVARLVRRLAKGATEYLFHDKGRRVGEEDLNAYIRSVAGPHTCKDFRTVGANETFIRCARRQSDLGTKAARKRAAIACLDEVAKRLGNTRAVAKSSYVMPGLVQAMLEAPQKLKGGMVEIMRRCL